MQIDATEAMQHAIELADLFAKPLFDCGRPQLGNMAVEMGLAVFSRMVLSDSKNSERHIECTKIYLRHHNSYILHRKDFADFLKTDDFGNLRALVHENTGSPELEKSLSFNGYYKHLAENWDGLTYDAPFLTTQKETRDFAQTLFNNPPSDFYETFLYAKAVNTIERTKNFKYADKNLEALDLAYAFARPFFDAGREEIGSKAVDIALPVFSSLVLQAQNVVPIKTLRNILHNISYVNGKDTHATDFSVFLLENNCEVLEKIIQREMGSAINMANSASVLEHVAKNWDGQRYEIPMKRKKEDHNKYIKMKEIFNAPHDDIYHDFLRSRIQKFTNRVNDIYSLAQKANNLLLADISNGCFLSVDQVQSKIMQRRNEKRQNLIEIETPQSTEVGIQRLPPRAPIAHYE